VSGPQTQHIHNTASPNTGLPTSLRFVQIAFRTLQKHKTLSAPYCGRSHHLLPEWEKGCEGVAALTDALPPMRPSRQEQPLPQRGWNRLQVLLFELTVSSLSVYWR